MEYRLLYTRFFRYILVALLHGLPVVTALQLHGSPTLTLQQAEELLRHQPDSAYIVLKDLYTHYTDLKDEINAGICLQKMGQVCYHLGYFAQSLDYHLRADKLFRQKNNRELTADNLNDMGLLYFYNKQPQQSRTQYNEALLIYQQLNGEAGLAKTYGNIGHLYEKEQQYDSAFYFQQLSLQHYRRINNQEGIARIYSNIGSIYEDKENYDSAYHYFSQAVNIYETTGNQLDLISCVNDLGDVYRKTGRYSEAMVQTRKALLLATQMNEQYQVAAAYRDIAKTFNLMRQNDSAYNYLEISREYLLAIYTRENNSRTAFLRAMNDVEKKNLEIEGLRNEHRAAMLLTAATIIIIILLITLGFTAFNRQRLKIRNERALSEQNRQIYTARNELIEAELKNKQLQEGQLKNELETRSKELTTHTLYVIQKNQLLDSLRSKLEEMVKDDKRDQKKQLQQLIQQINQDANRNQYWTEFNSAFEQVHQDFFDKLKVYSEDLTVNDLRLVALIKMNFSSADIATLLSISQDSLRVSRYRLKKKMNLQGEESLTAFIQAL
ncbi:MAG: tetratricopeptide repeat protein [Chitinophagaceae bacterium]